MIDEDQIDGTEHQVNGAVKDASGKAQYMPGGAEAAVRGATGE